MTVVLYHGCETVLALLGMTCVISLIAHHTGEAVFRLIGCSRDADREMGTMSGILFLILVLQTGLTGMKDGRRLTRLHRILCLFLMAMFHFMHHSIHQRLMTLSVAPPGARHHVRALGVSVGPHHALCSVRLLPVDGEFSRHLVNCRHCVLRRACYQNDHHLTHLLTPTHQLTPR